MKEKKKNREDKTRQKYVNIGSEKPWRIRVSIPVLPACKAGALPFELIPQNRLSHLKTTRKVTVIVQIEIFTWSILGYLVDNQVQ